MAYETILVEKRAAACVITFNRPHVRNAISTEVMDELTDAAKAAERDPEISGVIVTGGPTYFSAGADLNDALAIASPSDALAYFERWHRVNDTFESLAKPTIAAIEGFCLTGGCEFAMALDLRIAGAGSSFGITSSRIGTVAGAGGTQRLPRLVGRSKALEIMFSANPVVADEALRIGLVNEVTAAGGALARALELVAIYAERAPLSLALVKRAVHSGMQMDLKSGLDLETFLATTIYQTADRTEGITAFLEKRPAKFSGR
jgi:enoyl-CoA hydratase/carnithine racemase